MTELDDLRIPDDLLPALDGVVFGPHRKFEMPADLLKRFPDGLDETLVLGSIRWRKFVGRPTTRHLYEGFDVQIYRYQIISDQRPGQEIPRRIKAPIAFKLRDSNAHSDSHYSVHIVGHMAPSGNSDDRPYFAEASLTRGVKWTAPAKLVTPGQFRTVDPPKQAFVFPGPVRLDPFTVQPMMPQFIPK